MTETHVMDMAEKSNEASIKKFSMVRETPEGVDGTPLVTAFSFSEVSAIASSAWSGITIRSLRLQFKRLEQMAARSHFESLRLCKSF